MKESGLHEEPSKASELRVTPTAVLAKPIWQSRHGKGWRLALEKPTRKPLFFRGNRRKLRLIAGGMIRRRRRNSLSHFYVLLYLNTD